jgi:hypothetical protein
MNPTMLHAIKAAALFFYIITLVASLLAICQPVYYEEKSGRELLLKLRLPANLCWIAIYACWRFTS